MGIQKKHGKGRLDKWYKLAKEKGYRARAAFKLIQLNRKYGFLERSKVLLDLCAAPGSWCQVAAETMPPNSLILGVDLAPIKPIPRTHTFQGDITSDKCRSKIRQHLQTWKVDTVLHDGAPNVGTAWVQDAYSQAELVLQALRVASEFLVREGTFITKVFRSKDYNALLWVFNQLFLKVEATKPPSSRNASAEIYVVCRGFKAPRKIDPKFLDARTVFAELLEPNPNNEAKVFNPEKRRRKRDGYSEGNYTQFKEGPVSAFIQTTDPIAMLGSLNRLTFEPGNNEDLALAALQKLPETTTEVQQCCYDLGVLGRKEFRTLLRWRLKMRDKFGFSSNPKDRGKTSDEIADITPMDEELQIQKDLLSLQENEYSRKKRQRRRDNDKRQREITRMQMHMLPPTDIGLEQSWLNGEDSLIRLGNVDKAGAVETIIKGGMDIPVSKVEDHKGQGEDEPDTDTEEHDLEKDLDALYCQYQERKSETDSRHRAKRARTEFQDNEWEGLSLSGESGEDDVPFDSENESTNEIDRHVVLENTIRPHENQKDLTTRASLFFGEDLFRDAGIEEIISLDAHAEDSDHAVEDDVDTKGADDVSMTSLELERSLAPRALAVEILHAKAPRPQAQLEAGKDKSPKANVIAVNQNHANDNVSEFEAISPVVHDAQDFQRRPIEGKNSDVDIITAEAMTLAQQVATGKKTTHSLIDDGFNKYSFQDREGLPAWFLDDENKHSKPHRPISAAAAAAIKQKLRALNVRPIKKVREAKDRKKFRASQRLEKLRNKSALIATEDGTSEKDKAQTIAKLMSKTLKKKPKQQVKLVVARGGNRGIAGRPKGVKGKYKIVDARLKKDARAEKRLAKRNR